MTTISPLLLTLEDCECTVGSGLFRIGTHRQRIELGVNRACCDRDLCADHYKVVLLARLCDVVDVGSDLHSK